MSFQRFLGTELGEKSIDAETIGLFKEQFGKEGMREIFNLFDEKLLSLGHSKIRD